MPDGRDIDFLRTVVDSVRPVDPEDIANAEHKLRSVIDTLRRDERMRREILDVLERALSSVRLAHTLSETGILSDKSFFDELQRRLGEKFLPNLRDEGDIRSIVARVFDEPDDWYWVTRVEQDLWVELVELLLIDDLEHPRRDVRAAIIGLAQRIGAAGIDTEFYEKVHEVEDYDSPFLDLSVHARALAEAGPVGSKGARAVLLSTIGQCREMVVFLREHKRVYGTSLRLTSMSRRLLQQLDRLETLVALLAPVHDRCVPKAIAQLVVALVEAERTDSSLRRFLRDSADLVFFQITEETAKKGQKYITDTAPGYWSFLRKAMVGGAIVAVFALVKTALAGLPLSLGAQAALYSANYAACFVLIYMTGSILATKQPAVTASAIGQKLDDPESESGALEGVADLVVMVWRSQFVSFVGNLICAFPVALAIVWLLSRFGVAVATPGKAQVLVDSVAPFGSAALYYAAVAGVFLFLAGLISGMVHSRVSYTEIAERLAKHPALEALGDGRRRLANYLRDHLGMLVGNVALGVFLGSAGVVGVILGLPFDIRHIAFSSAHIGTAFATVPSMVTSEVVVTAALGVGLIGFVNFVVSFGATLWMTLESRRASFRLWRELGALLLERLRRRPADWFIPPSESRRSMQESA
jgi:site-specific recombinase